MRSRIVFVFLVLFITGTLAIMAPVMIAQDPTVTPEGTPPEEGTLPGQETGTPDGTTTPTAEGTPPDETATVEGTPTDETATPEGTPPDETATEEGTPSDETATPEGTPPDETATVEGTVLPEETATLDGTTTATASPTAAAGVPPPAGQPDSVTSNVFNTETRPFSQDLLAQLSLPAGFQITAVATDLGNSRMIAVSDTGNIYISRPMTNDVIMLVDQNSDGVLDLDGFQVVATDIPLAHGLVIQDNRLYIAGEKQIVVADINTDGTLGVTQVVTDGLPDGDQHTRRTIAFGPDGNLYVSLGSSCNACVETNLENATIARVPLDGSPRQTVALGLRNAMGFAWHPATGEMWGTDHGTDHRGDDVPPEELNRIQEGNHYGWPYCYGNQQADQHIPYKTDALFGLPNDQFCATTAAPPLTYQAHSAPINLVFYTGSQFPAEYTNDAFVTMRGSWNRFPATGYKVVRVHFDDGGQPTEFSDFLTGFLIEDGTAHFARIAGLAMTPDGSLLITDDTNGVLYRVTYTGQ